MASIKFDDGKEVQLSTETTERLRKELIKHNIPNSICVGQIYQINDSKYMVAVLGYTTGYKRGLTCVGGSSGCYSSSVLDGYIKDTELRALLIREDAKYLGMFRDVFKTVKGW